MNFLGAACAEGFQQALHGEAGIYDIFDNDNGASGDVFVDADHFFDYSRRRYSLIRGKFNERNLTRNGDALHQVGSKHERAVQHTQEKRILTCQIAVDFVRYTGYFFQYVLFLNGNGEHFVFYLYGIHKWEFLESWRKNSDFIPLRASSSAISLRVGKG